MQSVSELEENLKTYREQYQQVSELLQADPGNGEFEEMAVGLKEVIGLTEELLASARLAVDTEPLYAPHHALEQLPAEAVPRASFQHDQPHALVSDDAIAHSFAVGSKVEAVWSEDGEWYEATVKALTPQGYVVLYTEWGNEEEVDETNMRACSDGAGGSRAFVGDAGGEAMPAGVADTLALAEREAEATKQALKRKIANAAQADMMPKIVPAKLKINPDDSEDVKALKRKKIHSFKSKQRLQVMELTQDKRQNSWQQFQSGKGKQKKVGFFSGRQRESIFKSPEDVKGKVGVTGSGHGMTDFIKREKHLHTRASGEDAEDL